MLRRLSTLLCTLSLWLAAASGSAHDPGLSELTLSQGSFGIRFEWVLGDDELPTDLTSDSIISLSVDRQPLSVRIASRRYDATHTALTGALAPLTSGTLRVALALHELPRGHRVYARIIDREGSVTTQRLLEQNSSSLQTSLEAPARTQLLSIAGVTIALIALPFMLHRRGESAPARKGSRRIA